MGVPRRNEAITAGLSRPAPAALQGLSVLLALIGWTHLASPWGPDFHQALFGRQARLSLASQVASPASDERRRREARLRRALSGHGYRLMRSRLRPLPDDLGGYLVLEFDSGRIVVGGEPKPFTARLEEVEAWFRQDRPGRAEG
jgi:hypothetical protein